MNTNMTGTGDLPVMAWRIACHAAPSLGALKYKQQGANQAIHLWKV
jgi:hypothetical protein